VPASASKSIGWIAVILAACVLHQDVWFWRSARPLVFGFLPIGLAYHAAYCVVVALLMWGLTRALWPAHLEQPDRQERRI
jgi:hypothetical protein